MIPRFPSSVRDLQHTPSAWARIIGAGVGNTRWLLVKRSIDSIGGEGFEFRIDFFSADCILLKGALALHAPPPVFRASASQVTNLPLQCAERVEECKTRVVA